MAQRHHIESSVSTFISDIRKFIKFFTRYTIIDGVIENVYPDTFTCDIRIQTHDTPKDTDTIYTNVPLKVLKGVQASFVEIPTIGTRCEFTFRDGNNHRPQLIMVDQCDKYLIQIANSSTLIVDKDTWIFNGGNNDGMVLLQGLLTKINRLEDKLKNHEHAYIPYPGGSPATPILTTPASAATPPDNTLVFDDTTQEDLENTKIKQ
jgi:hypothetical protein